MKIFIQGLHNSGRTTVAKALIASLSDVLYIDANVSRSCLKDSELERYPGVVIQNISNILEKNQSVIIDGIENPRDFIYLFDYNKDIVIFLNRIDSMGEAADTEIIGTNVMRDYVAWLATMDAVSKDRWLELNYRIPGEDSDFLKILGARNTIIITKHITRAIRYLADILKDSLWKQEAT